MSTTIIRDICICNISLHNAKNRFITRTRQANEICFEFSTDKKRVFVVCNIWGNIDKMSAKRDKSSRREKVLLGAEVFWTKLAHVSA